MNTRVTVRVTKVPLEEVLKDIGLFTLDEQECEDCGCGKGDYSPS
ncbi:hypothetical protein [Bacillus toyonensis]|nr:hypothetical protein [Bacillus toyonensis]